MEHQQIIEKIYDWVENFDFEALTDDQKNIVLEHLSRAEYESMRQTISDTKSLFSKWPEELTEKPVSTFRKIISYKLEMYKIAAVIIVLFAIGYLLLQSQRPKNDILLASADTVYVVKHDTVVLHEKDTVEKIREKTVYINIPQKLKVSSVVEIPENSVTTTDCSKNICPDDLVKLTSIKGENNLSNDKELSGFIVSMN